MGCVGWILMRHMKLETGVCGWTGVQEGQLVMGWIGMRIVRVMGVRWRGSYDWT